VGELKKQSQYAGSLIDICPYIINRYSISQAGGAIKNKANSKPNVLSAFEYG
jgi:hypothetical protein